VPWLKRVTRDEALRRIVSPTRRYTYFCSALSPGCASTAHDDKIAASTGD